ncbi:MAG: hypothetical protein JWO57_849 [Pseudonocardiales bacterium]|nr:hypothetical protein [Pseudonocardiales bacterium]
MRAPGGGTTTVAVSATLLLALEALGLYAGGGSRVVVAGLIVIIAALTLARVSLPTVGIGAACIASFTLPWNGFLLGPVRPGDLLTLVALICFVAAGIHGSFPRLPWWVSQLGLAIVVVAVVNQLLPTDPRYLAGRIILGPNGLPALDNQSNLGVAFKFLVAVLAIPVVFSFASMHDRRALRWFAVAYAGGTSVSGLVAFSDHLGITTLGHQFTHNLDSTSREGGFSNHPNFLAGSCILAIATAIWLAASGDRRSRLIGIAVLPGIVLGTYASGSRGGAACLVLAMAISVVVIPRLRAHLTSVALVCGFLAVSAFVVFPGFGSAVLKATRLVGGGATTEGSNIARAAVGAQGLHDFEHSPFAGIGLQVAAQAQNVYLQELASGGIVLFAAMSIYVGAGIIAARRLMPYHDLAAPLLATALAAVVFNALEASLTDRFSYVPMGLIVALVIQHEREKRAAAELDEPPTVRSATWRSVRTWSERRDVAPTLAASGPG